MPQDYFQFKQFTVHQHQCAMKVTTEACLFGAWCAGQIAKENRPQMMLDIGGGTGLLSLMIAQQNPGIIDCVEIDTAAAAQATENIAASKWSNNIHIIKKNVMQWQPGKKYNSIISNPPFYQNQLKSHNYAKNTAHHDAGLKFDELIKFVSKHLAVDGKFYLLMPAYREQEIYSLLLNYNVYLLQKVFVKQTPAHQPFRVMMQLSRKEIFSVPTASLVIKNETGNYSKDFVALLKDYYLYL